MFAGSAGLLKMQAYASFNYSAASRVHIWKMQHALKFRTVIQICYQAKKLANILTFEH